MKQIQNTERADFYLKKLCREIPGRSVGTPGNRMATDFFLDEISKFGWEAMLQEFDALNWEDGGAKLLCKDEKFEVFVSPYSPGCTVRGKLVCARNLEDLQQVNAGGKILLLHGDIAKEQLMPKNFVFYNPAEHRQIIALLEEKKPAAIVCATGRNASLAGGVYPFPLIEDGDFNIPSVYMTDVEGDKLKACRGLTVDLISISRRIPGKGCNVVGRKEGENSRRLVVTAHIDAKQGTPGAIDNATGIVVLLLLAELLADYRGTLAIEMTAINGEDYYSVPGQMAYIRENRDRFKDIILNINIDGAGYKEGKTAWSFFNLPENMRKTICEIIEAHGELVEGPQWPQGDHIIFVQQGCPAIAVTSQWFLENIDTQRITHTPDDDMDVVDSRKLVNLASALNSLVRRLDK